MGARETAPGRLGQKVPSEFRVKPDLLCKPGEICVLIGGEPLPRRRCVVQLKQQILVEQHRARRHRRSGGAQHRDDPPHGFQKPLRVADPDQRTGRIDRKQSRLQVAADPFAVDADEVVRPALAIQVAVFEIGARMRQENVWPLGGQQLPPVDPEEKPAGVVVLHPVIDRNMVRLAAMDRQHSVQAEIKTVKIVHLSRSRSRTPAGWKE